MEETNSQRGASAASGLFDIQEEHPNTVKNRRLIGSEVGPYLIVDSKKAIDTKQGAARLSATTGNPLNLIEHQAAEERSIKAGGFNFYDM